MMVARMAKTGSEDSSKEKDALKEHEIASKIVKESGYGNATLLVGYIGKTDKDNSVRLYFNLNFDEFVDIPRDSILHAANASEDVLPFGGTYLWVKKDEHITHIRIESTKQQAKFLQGSISKGLVGPSPAPPSSMIRDREPHTQGLECRPSREWGGPCVPKSRRDGWCGDPSREFDCPPQSREWGGHCGPVSSGWGGPCVPKSRRDGWCGDPSREFDCPP